MTHPVYIPPEEMGGDEVMAMLIAAGIAALGAWRWLVPALVVRSLGMPASLRLGLTLTPTVCLGIMLPALLTIAAIEVREDMRYVWLFLLVGGAWLTLVHLAMPLVGVSMRDDALERRNPAAVVVVISAMLAATIIYLGGNTGEGPTIWTTIGPAALATVTWLGLWGIVEAITHVSEQITVERDTAAAVRHAGFLLAMALVLGRAIAGDWESSEATLRDFADLGWPAAAFAALMIPLHIAGRPTPQTPHPSPALWGIGPALLLLGFAAGWLRAVGPW